MFQSRTRHLAELALLLFCLSLSPLLWACKKEIAPPLDAYSVEGIVRGAPTDAAAGKQMIILHQAIPNFRDSDGKVVGMMSMPMPFLVAPGVDVAGVQAGDKIAFSFEVNWKAQVPTRVTTLRKLPADHEINFQNE